MDSSKSKFSFKMVIPIITGGVFTVIAVSYSAFWLAFLGLFTIIVSIYKSFVIRELAKGFTKKGNKGDLIINKSPLKIFLILNVVAAILSSILFYPNNRYFHKPDLIFMIISITIIYTAYKLFKLKFSRDSLVDYDDCYYLNVLVIEKIALFSLNMIYVASIFKLDELQNN